MSDHEEDQLVPKKKPDLDKQLELRISIGLSALTLAQALAESNMWALMIGLLLARDAWRRWRNLKNN
jgi:hypothetical protein